MSIIFQFFIQHQHLSMESSLKPSALHQGPGTSRLRREDPEVGWGISMELGCLQPVACPRCTHWSLMEGGLGRKPVHTITDSIREHTEEWVSRKPICAAPSSTYKWRLAECTITQRNLDAPSASLCSIYISLGQIMYF